VVKVERFTEQEMDVEKFKTIAEEYNLGIDDIRVERSTDPLVLFLKLGKFSWNVRSTQGKFRVCINGESFTGTLRQVKREIVRRAY
jgi:hypothetical protein